MEQKSSFETPVRLLAEELRSGRRDVRAIVSEAFEQFEIRGDTDHAYVLWMGHEALELAERIDGLFGCGADAGALMGIPLSIKDIFGVSGLPTQAGTASRLPDKWTQSGPVVTNALRQLPVMMGKSHTVPFAFGALGFSDVLGSPRNPWDPERHRAPGGSSSGAGVSIASGTARIAFGTDTHGSVRIPASLTGVAGLKITGGRWPIDGIVPLSHSLDTPGLLALSVDDLSYAFTAIDGDRSTEEVPVPELSSLTIGVPESFFWEGCSPGIPEAVENAISRLVSAGARRVARELPNASASHEMFMAGGLAATELAAFLEDELPGEREKLEPKVAARIEAARYIPATEYVRRLKTVSRMSREAVSAFEGVDVLMFPTVAATPPAMEDISEAGAYARLNMMTLRNTAVVNFMGLAALTLPVGRDAAGMPVGLQIVAPGWSEERLLAVGRAVERRLGSSLEVLGRPPMPSRFSCTGT